jgi:hypothetical protein
LLPVDTTTLATVKLCANSIFYLARKKGVNCDYLYLDPIKGEQMKSKLTPPVATGQRFKPGTNELEPAEAMSDWQYGSHIDSLAHSRPLARHSDPITSHEAAESVEPHTTRLEKMVYLAIKSQGRYGATWDELHVLTGIDKASISPRLKPLRKRKLVRAKIVINAKGERILVKRKGKSGRGQIVWVTPLK